MGKKHKKHKRQSYSHGYESPDLEHGLRVVLRIPDSMRTPQPVKKQTPHHVPKHLPPPQELIVSIPLASLRKASREEERAEEETMEHRHHHKHKKRKKNKHHQDGGHSRTSEPYLGGQLQGGSLGIAGTGESRLAVQDSQTHARLGELHHLGVQTEPPRVQTGTIQHAHIRVPPEHFYKHTHHTHHVAHTHKYKEKHSKKLHPTVTENETAQSQSIDKQPYMAVPQETSAASLTEETGHKHHHKKKKKKHKHKSHEHLVSFAQPPSPQPELPPLKFSNISEFRPLSPIADRYTPHQDWKTTVASVPEEIPPSPKRAKVEEISHHLTHPRPRYRSISEKTLPPVSAHSSTHQRAQSEITTAPIQASVEMGRPEMSAFSKPAPSAGGVTSFRPAVGMGSAFSKPSPSAGGVTSFRPAVGMGSAFSKPAPSAGGVTSFRPAVEMESAFNKPSPSAGGVTSFRPAVEMGSAFSKPSPSAGGVTSFRPAVEMGSAFSKPSPSAGGVTSFRPAVEMGSAFSKPSPSAGGVTSFRPAVEMGSAFSKPSPSAGGVTSFRPAVEMGSAFSKPSPSAGGVTSFRPAVEMGRPELSAFSKPGASAGGVTSFRPAAEGTLFVPPSAPTPHRPPQVKLTKGALKFFLKNLYHQIQKRDPEGIFGEPVTDDIAPGYSRIISHPMDLRTMAGKIETNQYPSVNTFKDDFVLMCTNAVTYNAPDTVYYATAKRLLAAGLKIIAKETSMRPDIRHGRVATAPRSATSSPLTLPDPHLPPPSSVKLDYSSPYLCRIDLSLLLQVHAQPLPNSNTAFRNRSTSPSFLLDKEVGLSVAFGGGEIEDQSHLTKVSVGVEGEGEEGGFDSELPEDVLMEAQAAAEAVKENLDANRSLVKFCFYNRDEEGKTMLNILNPDSGEIDSRQPLDLTVLQERVRRGNNAATVLRSEIPLYKATPVSYLMYGPFGSFAPAYDSAFATLSKMDSDLLLSTYGNEMGVNYAHSLQQFVKGTGSFVSEMANAVLNGLTSNRHSKFMETFKAFQEKDRKPKEQPKKEESGGEQERDNQASSRAVGTDTAPKPEWGTPEGGSSSEAGSEPVVNQDKEEGEMSGAELPPSVEGEGWEGEGVSSTTGEGTASSLTDSESSPEGSKETTAEGIDDSRSQTCSSLDLQLGQASELLTELHSEQLERLSQPLREGSDGHLLLPGPSEREMNIASKLTDELTTLTSQVHPRDVVSVPALHRAMGIAVQPVEEQGRAEGEAASIAQTDDSREPNPNSTI